MGRKAVDFDGTVNNQSLNVANQVKKDLKVEVPLWRTDRTNLGSVLNEQGVPEDKIEPYLKHLNTFLFSGKYLEKTELMPDVETYLRMLAEEHTLFLVTHRGEELLPGAIKYLKDNKILSYFKDVYSSSVVDQKEGRILSKQEICIKHNLDTLIDDDPIHLDFDFPGINKILFTQAPKGTYNQKGLSIANNWEEVYNIISSTTPSQNH